MELLSVIVPVYNCEEYVECCIKSVLSQTYPAIELILVDDGSTDNSRRICDFYAQNYKNVTSLHQEHGGITKARLKGAEFSHGSWITFVDADDWIKEDFYETFYKENDSCDLMVSGIIRYYDETTCVENKTYYKPGIYDKKRIMEEIVPTMLWTSKIETWALDPSLCTKLFKRELLIEELRKAEKVRSNYGEDSMVIFPMIFKINKLKVIEDAFYYHRQRPKSVLPEYIQEQLFLEKLYAVYQYLKEQFRQMGYWEVMQEQTDMFYMDSIEHKRKAYGYENRKYKSFVSMFPFDEIKKNSKVIIYGAGKVGEIYIKQNEEYKFCQVISWVDQKNDLGLMKQKKVESVESIPEKDFDYIVIAVDKYEAAAEIGENLLKLGVSKEKIIWKSIRKYFASIWE